MRPVDIRPADIRPRLHATRIGQRLFYYPETDSTNDVAMAAAREGEPEGSVFYADHQRRGRGRRGRHWEDGGGRDVIFSVVLRPPGELRDVLPVTLAASLALSVCLSKATGADVGVKWPNDIMAGGRKLGGILAESAGDGGGRLTVVGVGVNVNGTSFSGALADTAVSCRMLAGDALERASLFGDILTVLDGYYGRFCSDGFGPLAPSYRERMVHADAPVRFRQGGVTVTAATRGVEADGALRVQPDEGGEILLYNETLELVT